MFSCLNLTSSLGLQTWLSSLVDQSRWAITDHDDRLFSMTVCVCVCVCFRMWCFWEISTPAVPTWLEQTRKTSDCSARRLFSGWSETKWTPPSPPTPTVHLTGMCLCVCVSVCVSYFCCNYFVFQDRGSWETVPEGHHSIVCPSLQLCQRIQTTHEQGLSVSLLVTIVVTFFFT